MNQRIPSLSKKTAPRYNPRVMHVWYGYDDYANGRGFRRDYEKMKYFDQRNYERGRQIAAAVKGVLQFVPKWKQTQLMTNMLNSVEHRLNVSFKPALEGLGDLFGKDRLTTN